MHHHNNKNQSREQLTKSNDNNNNNQTEEEDSVGWLPLSEIIVQQSHPLEQQLKSADVVPSPSLPSEQKQKAEPVGVHTFKLKQAPECIKHQDPAYRQCDEFTSCYYTPIVCQPEDFTLPENQYTLRQCMFQRRTELLICITMYNESDEDFMRTMTGLLQNLRYLIDLYKIRGQAAPQSEGVKVQKDQLGCSYVQHSNQNQQNVRGDSVWRQDAWQKVVVMIISDGRSKCHKRVLQIMSLLGVYHPEAIMTQRTDPLDKSMGDPNGTVKDVTCHLFETTTQISVDSEQLVPRGYRASNIPVQMIFALKERNQKKLNSHKWLFRAFAPMLNPYVCLLIDVGTTPKSRQSIYNLWRPFDRNLRIAGACGEITVMMGTGCTLLKNLMNPLVAAQNFEYRCSSILDKTLESCFGYISVLPGAFCAFRWEALQDISPDEGPLVSYFKGENPSEMQSNNVFESNMYLAEDRILCLELVGKRDQRWILSYIKDAVAETDAPSTAHELINQRRRWANGSFFCQAYAVYHLGKFWRTNHSFLKKVALTFQIFYIFVSLLFSWFALANFYLAFYLITQETFQSSWVFDLARWAYVAVIVAVFICSLGNRPQGAKSIYVGSMIIYGLIMIYLLAVTILLIIKQWPTQGASWISEGGTSRDIVISTASTYGLYFISALLYGELWHIVTCIAQYMLLLPSYINTLTIFAFSNVHDISWGTKGSTEAVSQKQKLKIAQEVVETDSRALLQPFESDNAQLQGDYHAATQSIAVRPPVERQHRDKATKKEDYFKNFRTWLLLAWVFSNGLLIVVVSTPYITSLLIGSGGNADGSRSSNPYIAFIMYAVAVQSLIRFLGCLLYLINRWRRGY